MDSIHEREQITSAAIVKMGDAAEQAQKDVFAEIKKFISSLPKNRDGTLRASTQTLVMVNRFVRGRAKAVLVAGDYKKNVNGFTGAYTEIADKTKEYFKNIDNAK